MKLKLLVNLTLLAALLCSLFPGDVNGQLENVNWHFGVGVGVEITPDGPVLTDSNINAFGIICPSAISSSSGQLRFYSDGNNVYNSNGDIIENGDLSSGAVENVFVPYPGDDSKCYLFRSDNNGVDYSVIDENIGDAGGIDPAFKEIDLYDTGSQLICASIADGSGYWLITADNNDGFTDDIHLNAYSISSSGVALVSEITEYFFFAGWNATLDDARISPDCSKIAISYKGHYVALLKFDNETGSFYDIIYDGMDTGASFVNITELEFSANSELLYALGDYNTVRQYSLDSWNFTDISSSVNIIDQNFGQSLWNDIKLAPDGKIYLLNDDQGQLDVINQPDVIGAECDLQSGVLDIPTGISTYLPNLPNVTCQAPFLDLIIDHQYECLGDLTELWYIFPAEPDSVLWNFNDPSTGDLNTSNLDSPIHVFSAVGSYEVTFIYYLNGEATEYLHNVNIYEIPDPNLGPDQTFCQGQSVELNAGPSNYNYTWTPSGSGNIITVTSGGTYNVVANNNGCIGSDEVVLDMIPYAVVDLGDDIILCDASSATIDSDLSGISNIVWSTGSTSESITVTSSGTYWASGSNSCFNATDSIQVTFINVPTSFLPGDLNACEGDTIPVLVNLEGWNVQWNPGGSTNELLITEEGTYTATITQGPCSATDDITVEMTPFVPLDLVIMPNVFTPNGDAHNKYFTPFMPSQTNRVLCDSPVVTIDLRVYDRWGLLLTEEGACHWDGNTNNNEVPEGVYYYIVDIHSQCVEREENKTIDGHLTLLRK